jgi:hypothetical protein
MTRWTEPARSGTARWQYESKDGLILATFDVAFTRTPYDPGFVSGPPDRCYPPEGGEIEITAITLKDWTRWRDGDDDKPEELADLSAAQRLTIARKYSELIHTDRAISDAAIEACEDAYRTKPDSLDY